MSWHAMQAGSVSAFEENVRDQIQAIGDAVEELRHEGPGDVLVFLSGEREIRGPGAEIQHAALCDLAELQTVVALVAEEARLVAVFEIHQITDAMLANANYGRGRIIHLWHIADAHALDEGNVWICLDDVMDCA